MVEAITMGGEGETPYISMTFIFICFFCIRVCTSNLQKVQEQAVGRGGGEEGRGEHGGGRLSVHVKERIRWLSLGS